MPRQMKAAVLREYNQPLVIEDVTIEDPKAGEVLIRQAACGICHSDVNVVLGQEKWNLPVILGHESAGYVEAVGAGVTHLKPGDRVAASLLRSCGRCFYCTSGMPSLCDTPHPLDSETRHYDANGKPITLGMRMAGWAEYALVDQSQVVTVPDSMALETAALVGCGVITGVGAVINTAQVEVGSSVVVLGLGGVGINAVQAARVAGARHVIAVDLLDTKLETAQAFGATHLINAGRENAVQTVKDITNGRGADYVFVTVGSQRAISQSFEMLRKRGTTVIIGLTPNDEAAALPVRQVALTEVRVLGSFLGSTRLNVAFPQFVELYEQKRLKLDELITATYPLEQINEAIAVVERGEAVRNIIVF